MTSAADPAGRALCETTVKATAGLNRLQWTLAAPMLAAGGAGGGRGGPPGAGGAGGGAGGGGGAAPQGGPGGGAPNTSCSAGGGGGRGGGPAGATPGSYIVKLTVGGREYTKPVTVLEDKWMMER